MTNLAIKNLEWDLPTRANNGLWVARCCLGTYHVGCDGGYWHAGLNDNMNWEWEPEEDPRSYRDERPAMAACQDHFVDQIRSALRSA